MTTAMIHVETEQDARRKSLDLYKAWLVPGAQEWLADGVPKHLPRRWRELLVPTERIVR